MVNKAYFHSPVGWLSIEDNGTALTKINFEKQVCKEDGKRSKLADMAIQQLEEYFSGKRRSFSLPMAPEGTQFMLDVWRALISIPYGEVISYGDIARAIEKPKAARAVGMANNRNPLPIIIPCHRVIGANGQLVGYAGGLGCKEKLLALEKENSKKE
ncbi:MAG: methylated-DNA--[protein]-cysteine S-methyltransferase [Acholeplasmataceae bacterium]|nr:methylated-DNA--[protein]-cysteine S-methyltransferase [Acholeplasmataceae bacterium]